MTVRVLLVEDDAGVAGALAESLHARGHPVTSVARGADALHHHRTADLVLLDLGLPDLDGCELSKRLRAAHGSSLVLIAVTGRSGDDEHNEAMAAGVDHVLCKPLSQESLRRFFPPLN